MNSNLIDNLMIKSQTQNFFCHSPEAALTYRNISGTILELNQFFTIMYLPEVQYCLRSWIQQLQVATIQTKKANYSLLAERERKQELTGKSYLKFVLFLSKHALIDNYS